MGFYKIQTKDNLKHIITAWVIYRLSKKLLWHKAVHTFVLYYRKYNPLVQTRPRNFYMKFILGLFECVHLTLTNRISLRAFIPQIIMFLKMFRRSKVSSHFEKS